MKILITLFRPVGKSSRWEQYALFVMVLTTTKMLKVIPHIKLLMYETSTLFLDESNFDEICLPRQQGDKYCVSDESIIIARSGIPGATRILCNPSSNIIFCGFIICCTPYNNTLQNYLTLYLKQFEGSSATQTAGSICLCLFRHNRY